LAVKVSVIARTSSSELLDDRCREELGVSATEFLARIQSNTILSDWPPDAVTRLQTLLPFAK
jgi:hypothetical protein